tara:strand:- start:526 stop:678 length:153 start_codon:yes stop_codon:yes gene_type:complete
MIYDIKNMPEELFKELADSAQMIVDIESGNASVDGLKTHEWTVVDFKRVG